MGFAFIRDGDTTSHGGRVIASDMTNTVDGKALALLGDMVSCPRCGGIYPIVKIKADLNMTFNGRPVASDGDMTACGATLIASQSVATASPTSGVGAPVGGEKSVIAQHDGAIADASSSSTIRRESRWRITLTPPYRPTAKRYAARRTRTAIRIG